MNLIENWCHLYLEQKYKLEEMARSKRDIIKDLDSNRTNMYNHLINCYLWTDTTDYIKWKGEIRASIFSTFSIKGSNKYPTREQLLKWCMEDWIIEVRHQIDKIVDEAYEEENIKRKKLNLKGELQKPLYNSQLICDYIIEYINWLSENICDGQQINTSQVSAEVDMLIDKYKK